MIARLAVVIPARDEEDLIAAALEAVSSAAARVVVPVRTFVVADRCRDDTERIARSRADQVLHIDDGNVGAARAAGADAAIAWGADWLSFTDADSTVPSGWLDDQLRHEREGADLVLGTVRPAGDGLSPGERGAWARGHGSGRAIGNVYGANLGIRTSVYLAAGGFRALRAHEDQDLVRRARPLSATVACDHAEVVTSARRWGRTPAGFAQYLRECVLDGGDLSA